MVIRRVLAVAVLLAALAAGCGNPVVHGHIPPSTFQFTTVLDHDGPRPGGWQVAQVLVLLGRLGMMFPRAAVCQVQVGVPLVTAKLGVISVEYAQVSSATAADAAARELMEKRAIPTATACSAFRETMQRLLGGRTGLIPGARVTRFDTDKVPRRTFPPKRGRGT